MIPNENDPEAWEKPSVYSLGVIAVVFALLGWLLHTGQLTITEGLIGAVFGVLTWVTKGARPPIVNKIGPRPPPPPSPPPLPPEQPAPDVSSPLRTSLLLVVLIAGCAALTPQEKARMADKTYAAELKECVAKAETREESQACRADVRKDWNVDGGAR